MDAARSGGTGSASFLPVLLMPRKPESERHLDQMTLAFAFDRAVPWKELRITSGLRMSVATELAGRLTPTAR